MPFDPSKPADHTPLFAEEMRDQLNALKALIDALPTVTTGRVTAEIVLHTISGTSGQGLKLLASGPGAGAVTVAIEGAGSSGSTLAGVWVS